jgi:tRNA threonylcarbamoyladenosine modification (KEOPS) complex  Pcc1 subunit
MIAFVIDAEKIVLAVYAADTQSALISALYSFLFELAMHAKPHDAFQFFP